MKVFSWLMAVFCWAFLLVEQGMLWYSGFNSPDGVPLFVIIPINLLMGVLTVALACLFTEMAMER